MNAAELKAAMARKGLSIPKLADCIGIGKKAFYQKMRGETQFKLCEIQGIATALDLSPENIRVIFFDEKVS